MIVIVYYPDSTTHLALALTGLADKNIYISFFPPYVGSGMGFRLTGIEKDKKHDASHIVILPTEESCKYGLSEQAIYDWWNKKFNRDNNIERFEWLTNNCSSVVYRALLEGQKGAISLKNQIILERESGIVFPAKIRDYAIKLHAKLMRIPNIDDEITLKHIELKQCCLLDMDDSPYSPYNQATAIYWRLKSFNTNQYSLTLQKPFCDGIKKVLSKLYQLEAISNCTDLIEGTQLVMDKDDIDSADIDKWFRKLSDIANYIYNKLQKSSPESVAILENEMKNAIKKDIILPIITLLDSLNSSIYLEQKNKIINQSKILEGSKDNTKLVGTLNDLATQIDDKKNPHIEYFKEDKTSVVAITNIYRAR